MALSDLFTLPFLLSLGLTLLLTGLLGMFFVQKLQEQNHKMTSMLGLVSTMAEELNFIRGRLQYTMQFGGAPASENTIIPSNAISTHLIPVSDDENDSEDSNNESDDSDNEDDEDSDPESLDEANPSDPVEVNEIIELSNEQTVKVINFGETFPPSTLEANDVEDLDYSEDDNEGDECDEDDSVEDESDIEDLDENDGTQKKTPTMDAIKSVAISTLEESNLIDYKKLSLQKLKSIAIDKGLIQESSKATKNAILKLLGVE